MYIYWDIVSKHISWNTFLKITLAKIRTQYPLHNKQVFYHFKIYS